MLELEIIIQNGNVSLVFDTDKTSNNQFALSNTIKTRLYQFAKDIVDMEGKIIVDIDDTSINEVHFENVQPHHEQSVLQILALLK